MAQPLIQHPDIIHHHTVSRDDLNAYGMMHGGGMLRLCDEVSYLAAQRHAQSACLTKAVHRARFHRGVFLGAELAFHAKVGLVGHSSLWVPIEVCHVGEGCVVMDAVFVFVAVDDDRRPISVPALPIRTEEDKRLHALLARMREQSLQD